MPKQADIDALGEMLASDVTTAERTHPPTVMTSEGITNVVRPHVMKRGFAKAIAAALDPPWMPVAATNSSDPLAIKFATGWANKGIGWCPAEYRWLTLLSRLELRGYVFTAGSSPTILTVPSELWPTRNELWSTMIDFQPAYIHTFVDGTVAVNYAELATRQHVLLSGISWEVPL